MRRARLFALAFVTLAAACDTPTASPRAGDREDAPTPVDGPDGVVAAAPGDGGEDPQATVDDLRTLTPTRARDGSLRFASPLVHEPGALPILLERLRSGGEPPEVRAALAEAIARTGGAFGPEAIAILADEADPRVRVNLVTGLRRADADSARAGVDAGLGDPDPGVRAAAARVAGYLAGGAAHEEALTAAVGDADGRVRVAAIRALGVLKLSSSWDTLTAAVGDDDPAIRLHAARALGRIDRERARALPQLQALIADPDPKVASAAAKLTR